MNCSILYDRQFTPLDHNTIYKQYPENTGSVQNTKATGPEGEDIFIKIIPISDSKTDDTHMVLQCSSPLHADSAIDSAFYQPLFQLQVSLLSNQARKGMTVNRLKKIKPGLQSLIDLVHSSVESVYEFTDYAPLTNDIILINKK